MLDKVDHQERIEPRTNLFVMATISAAGGSGPVKVRNISPSGALIEGSMLPAPKEHVRLRRGDLVVTAEVVWCRDGRAGLRFHSTVAVSDWLPKGANRVCQQRTDELVQHVRAGMTGSPPAPVLYTAPATLHGPDELEELAQAIDSLAETLADDDAIMERHASQLQTLDIAAQILRKLAATR